MQISIRFLLLLFSIVLHAYGQRRARFGELNLFNHGRFRSNNPTPFPQCLKTESAKELLQPHDIQLLFEKKLTEENSKLTQERNRNINLNNGKRLQCTTDYSNDFSSISIKMILWISKKCNYEMTTSMALYYLERQPKPLKKFFNSTQ